MMTGMILGFLLVFVGCSGGEESEKEKQELSKPLAEEVLMEQLSVLKETILKKPSLIINVEALLSNVLKKNGFSREAFQAFLKENPFFRRNYLMHMDNFRNEWKALLLKDLNRFGAHVDDAQKEIPVN